MNGARLIVNARYFHIAVAGETATKYAFIPEAAAGLVNYVATRESVVLNFTPEYEQHLASQEQRDAIERFLGSAPDIEKSREYKAYMQNGTAANATRLINRAAQYVFGVNESGDVMESKPATRAQRERIREFVEKVPAIRQTPEYMDYKANPTRENASEVLSHALEVGIENSADPETLRIMLNYIAERPGAVKDQEKQHGLFCADGIADLEAEKDAIAAHEGNIYSLVFSLRREDADALGYDGQAMWRNLFTQKQAELAKALRVSVSELHWVAAVHNTRHHPHAHFIAYSTKPQTRMYLSKNALESIKSDFVAEIFRDERYSIFAPREEIRQQLEARIEQLLAQLNQNGAAELAAQHIPEKLVALKTAIEQSPGRHVYKYLPKNVKAMVDRLLDELSSVPEIKALLAEYNQYQQQLEAFYKTNPDEPKPLSAITTRSNLYPLKNLVVQCAMQTEVPDEITLPLDKTGSTSGFFASEDLFSAPTDSSRRIEAVYSVDNNSAQRSGESNVNRAEALRQKAFDGSAEDKFRYAQYLRYQSETPEEATLWYNLADQVGHAEAAYQLAQYYFRDPADQDIPLANEYLLNAKIRFEDQLRESSNGDLIRDIDAGMTYADADQRNDGLLPEASKKMQKQTAKAAFFLGRIHLCGIEIESIEGIELKDIPHLQVASNPHKAAAYLELAFHSGYADAAYYLGKLYFRGNLSPDQAPDYTRAADWYTVGMEQSSYCRFALAGMVERGQGFTPSADIAETLYRKCLGENSYLMSESAYAIAEMQHNGALPQTDMQSLYQQAADIWLKQRDPEEHIRLRLARMYEYGLGVSVELPTAIRYYESVPATPNTHYKLGQLLQRVGGDPHAVYEHYAQALDGMLRQESDTAIPQDAQRAVRLATMYRYSLGTERDMDAAAHWYDVAAQRGSIYADQQLHSIEAHRAEQDARAAEQEQHHQEQRNMSIASRLLSMLGNALRGQTMRDQQPAARLDHKQRREQRRIKHALGQKEDFEHGFE